VGAFFNVHRFDSFHALLAAAIEDASRVDSATMAVLDADHARRRTTGCRSRLS
jgi:hypothetical protein